VPNFSSLAGLEVAEKLLWVGGGWGGVCTVIFVSNPTVVLCCVGVGVLTISFYNIVSYRFPSYKKRLPKFRFQKGSVRGLT